MFIFTLFLEGNNNFTTKSIHCSMYNIGLYKIFIW